MIIDWLINYGRTADVISISIGILWSFPNSFIKAWLVHSATPSPEGDLQRKQIQINLLFKKDSIF